ncbi:MAG: hypothetical protein AAGC72_16010 [Planctomycetota bacterium]
MELESVVRVIDFWQSRCDRRVLSEAGQDRGGFTVPVAGDKVVGKGNRADQPGVDLAAGYGGSGLIKPAATSRSAGHARDP